MQFKVTFHPLERSVWVQSGTPLRDAAQRAGIRLDTPCAGKGTCAKCRVRIIAGKTDPACSEHRLTNDELARGVRLACVTCVTDHLDVEIPHDVLHGPFSSGQVLTTGEAFSIVSDAYPTGAYGIAVDIGTTTIVGVLYDLSSGRDVATAAQLNAQIEVGDDVLSRIAAVREDYAQLEHLRLLVVGTLNRIFEQLYQQAACSGEQVVRIVLAGNTTMQQIVLGIDPSALGELPFMPAFYETQRVCAGEIGLHAAAQAEVVVFPQIGGFVGGDTVAGLLAVNALTLVKPTVMVDIGTNGEIVLFANGQLFAASTAAGPAFEGARIQQGMRAVDGAIDHVLWQNNMLSYHVIGGMVPRGLCGSALVDLVAILLQLGILDASGTFVAPAVLPSAIPALIRARVTDRGFVVAVDASGLPLVTLTQHDVRELQLAAGAIRAGVETLLVKAGITVADLDAVLLAGGFGNYIRREHAMRIGLLPKLSLARVKFIGNAALTGAKRALLSQSEEAVAMDIQRRVQHVELAAEACFADLYMDAMVFPNDEQGGTP